VHGAPAVVRAVAARAVDLAIVVGVKVDNVDVATSVVLDDLVGRLVGTAANDVGGAAALDANGILADVLEPDELEVAGALAVDALLLVGTNDDIAEGGAVLKNEDSVLLA
jgi:hypothetical protein